MSYTIAGSGGDRVLKLVRRLICVEWMFLFCCCKGIQCDLQDNDPHPWWQVDLGTEHCVGKVNVTLRVDCCDLYRFAGAMVRAGLSTSYAENQPCGVPATREQSTNGAVNEFLCDPPRMARYVSLDIDKSLPDVTQAYLMLAEVDVFTQISEECDVQEPETGVLLRGSSFTQSSTFGSEFDAQEAIDGDIKTFTHTAGNDPHPWWQVYLGTEHYLGKVIVKLRGDCCNLYRFAGAMVRAGLSTSYAENQPCGVPATREQSTNGAVNEFLCDPPRMARYVSLDIDKSLPDITQAYMMLAEVQVFNYTSRESKQQNPKSVGQPLKPNNFKILHKNGLIGNGNPLATEVARSLPLCAVFCLIQPGCVSLDYAPGNNQCHLYNISAAYIQITPHQDFSVYVKETN